MSFPTKKEDFGTDDRISYYEEDGKWILEDANGAEWEWVEATSKWVPALSEAEIAQQQQAYVPAGADESVTAEEQFKNKKRKMMEQAKSEPNKKSKAEKANSAVYVTSIPLDATIDEIHEVFSKYGIIAEEIDSTKPRIKMYTDEKGNFKGDALVVYFRPESVDLAIQMLDEAEFRWGARGPDGLMRVRLADSSYKKTQQQAADTGDSGASTPIRRGKKGDKQKIIEKTMRLNQRLADWSDDEDGGALLNPEIKKEVKKASKWDKVVVLKHLFTIEGLAEELKENPDTKMEIVEDTKELCEDEYGEVIDLFLFDLEPEGIITVRFATEEAAQKCVADFNAKGKVFDRKSGKKVEASISTGQRFRKSKPTDEDEEAERRRLEAFAESLENAPDE